MQRFYGHSRKGMEKSAWEPLEAHLQLVATLTERFAEKLKATEFARLLGYWHDLGKYDVRFQAYLDRENGFETHLEGVSKINHSNFGAQHAIDQFTGRELPLGFLLAYCIMGHHAGLPDYSDLNPDAKRASSLSRRLQDQSTRISLQEIPEWVHQKIPLSPPALQVISGREFFQFSFWTRMMFSCLVDGDYLATEQFMTPERSEFRPVAFQSWEEMNELLDRALQQKAQTETPLGQIRRSILDACLSAAELRPGFFSLTVPTGGGKTLSSLAFALKHLRQHGHERIIYGIPFTSIVEQTAEVFRNVFGELGESAILEHHCNVEADDEQYSSRLATENWDAPVIVTTNVQLLETLFAASPSRCRKLHRIAGSVIVLDEAQTLPVELLKPCLYALQELVTNYRCTIVLCTATQPAIHQQDDFSIGLTDVCEIIPEPQELARKMRRVDVQYLGPIEQGALVDRLKNEKQFLCIVNYKRDASGLYRLFESETGSQGLYHLSTNLCAEHRFEKLREIRDRLHSGDTCRVISTQLIEAGVDVDFPVVYRALAGLDSVAQAAGRCNREGKRSCADVFVFEPTGADWSESCGYQKQTSEITQKMLLDRYSPVHEHGWLATETVNYYFRENYWANKASWDKKDVLANDMLCSDNGKFSFQFRQMASRFRLIEQLQIPVFIRYNKAAKNLLEQLRKNLLDPDHKSSGLERRQLLRKLQKYTVGIPEQTFRSMVRRDISVLQDDREQPTEFYELVSDSCYHSELGFFSNASGILQESQSIF